MNNDFYSARALIFGSCPSGDDLKISSRVIRYIGVLLFVYLILNHVLKILNPVFDSDAPQLNTFTLYVFPLWPFMYFNAEVISLPSAGCHFFSMFFLPQYFVLHHRYKYMKSK